MMREKRLIKALSEEPHLMRQWKAEHNPMEDPTQISVHARDQFTWECEVCQLVYKRSIATQYKQNGACPRCVHRRRIESRCLALTHPEIAQTLVDELNQGWTAKDLTFASNRKMYWRCLTCHEISRLTPAQRLKSERCGYCTGKRVATFNSLATLNPVAASEWDYVKNEGVTPNQVTANSNKEYWFRCRQCDHSWLARCNARTSAQSGCPMCARERQKEQLKTRHQSAQDCNITQSHPWLAKEWHPTLNAPLIPEAIRAKSNRWIWWQCQLKECGHTWRQQVVRRTTSIKWQSCPMCQQREETTC